MPILGYKWRCVDLSFISTKRFRRFCSVALLGSNRIIEYGGLVIHCTCSAPQIDVQKCPRVKMEFMRFAAVSPPHMTTTMTVLVPPQF